MFKYVQLCAKYYEFRNIFSKIVTYQSWSVLLDFDSTISDNLILTASKFALFSVSGLKDEKLIKKQIYMKPETCKLYFIAFGTFRPNFIKIDLYNFELYRFKFGAFFETQCIGRHCSSSCLSRE